MKLNEVGQVYNRPTTNKYSKYHKSQSKRASELQFWENVYPHMSHVMCHKLQFFSSSVRTKGLSLSAEGLLAPGPTPCNLWYFEDLEEKADWLNEWISNKDVYRTAPATPGLLTRL